MKTIAELQQMTVELAEAIKAHRQHRAAQGFQGVPFFLGAALRGLEPVAQSLDHAAAQAQADAALEANLMQFNRSFDATVSPVAA